MLAADSSRVDTGRKKSMTHRHTHKDDTHVLCILVVVDVVLRKVPVRDVSGRSILILVAVQRHSVPTLCMTRVLTA